MGGVLACQSMETGHRQCGHPRRSRLSFRAARHQLHALLNVGLSSTIVAVDNSRGTITNDEASVHLGENKRPVIVGV